MRRIFYAIAVLCILMTSGCAVNDWIFAAFGDHYSGGGLSRAEKQDHYDRESEKWKGYDRFGTTNAADPAWHSSR